MPAAIWLAANATLVWPLALIAVVVARELVRAACALLLGFRVFEIHLGIGRPLVAGPIGPVDCALRRLPFGGATIAASGSPKRFRLTQLILASLPLGLQLVWLATDGAVDSSTWTAITSGMAPLAGLNLANAVLLVFHGIFPAETRSGLRTDVRSLLDLAFEPARSSRRTRASYYARQARHAVERGRVDAARASVEQGLIQLGREPLLVACAARLSEGELASVIDQGECADALESLIAENEPRRHLDRVHWSWAETTRQAAISALPLCAVSILGVAVEADRIADRIHRQLVGSSSEIADTGADAECARQLDAWSRWAPRLDLLLAERPEIQRDRFDQLARLERCRGQIASALRHHARALEAAAMVRAEGLDRIAPDPLAWLAGELAFVRLLQAGAELEIEQRAYRDALARIGQAEDQLQATRRQVGRWPVASDREQAGQSIETEYVRLISTRQDALTRLKTR